jgi:hypothetical protein
MIPTFIGFMIVFSPKILAQDPIRGYELEFTSNAMIKEFEDLDPNDQEKTSSPQNRAARKKLSELIAESCTECTVTSETDKYNIRSYRISYSDGFSFQITVDPGLLEIIINKTASSLLHRNEQRLQRDLFDNIAMLGLFPEKEGASMHFNMDVDTSFENSVIKFHNFIISLFNQKAVITKVLSEHDPFNAPFIDDLSTQQQKAFISIQDDFHQGKISTVDQYARRLMDDVFYKSNWEEKLHPEDKHQKYMLFNLIHLAKGRLEFRGFRTPKTSADLIRLDRFINSHWHYIAGLKQPIHYAPHSDAPLRQLLDWTRKINFSIDDTQKMLPPNLRGAFKVMLCAIRKQAA